MISNESGGRGSIVGVVAALLEVAAERSTPRSRRTARRVDPRLDETATPQYVGFEPHVNAVARRPIVATYER